MRCLRVWPTGEVCDLKLYEKAPRKWTHLRPSRQIVFVRTDPLLLGKMMASEVLDEAIFWEVPDASQS